ncbi:MAG: type I-E CRISPR-associated protein Cse2/CasB [Thiohalomonadaceae bacterium]
MSAFATQGSEQESAKKGLPEIVGRIAWALEQPHYPNGDRAALKRWSPAQALPLAYYRLWLQHLRQDPPPDEQAQTWMAIAWGLAFAGHNGHEPKRPLGQALAEAGFIEARLERLLSAPEELRIELYQSAVRFLVAKGMACNYTDWAAWLLTEDAEKRDALNRRIASQYYRHLAA